MFTKSSDILLPANSKYESQNRISKWLIYQFIASLRDLLSKIDAQTDDIVDIGCGEGVILFHLKKLFPDSDIVGVDLETDLLSIAKKIVPGVKLVNGSVYDLPLKKQSYDMVICTEVLEHLDDPLNAIKEIRGIGRKYFLFSVPHEPWWRMANMARFSYIQHWGNTPGHVNHWTKTSFIKFLNSYLRIIAIKKPFPWIMILCQK